MKPTAVLIPVMFVLTASCHHRIQPNATAGLSEGAVIENVIVANNRRVPTETIKAELHVPAQIGAEP